MSGVGGWGGPGRVAGFESLSCGHVVSSARLSLAELSSVSLNIAIFASSHVGIVEVVGGGVVCGGMSGSVGFVGFIVVV